MIRYIALLSFGLLLAAVAILLFTLPTPAPGTLVETDAQERPAGTLISNVRLLKNGQLTEPQSILIEDGLIAAVGDELEAGDSATLIDGEGGTALAGMIDAHTHMYGTSSSDALRFGVATTLDMFTDRSTLPTARESRAQRLPTRQADMFSAGMLATAPGGHGTQYGVTVDTLTAPEQALEWVRARKAEGSDYIKLVYIPNTRGFPTLERATARAVIEAAHAEGLMALVHISTQGAALAMIEDGVDGLVHVFADEPASDELIQLAVERDIFVIPTLSVIDAISEGSSDEWVPQSGMKSLSPMQEQTLGASFGQGLSGYHLDTALENVRRLHEAGVPILAGSDAPNPGTAQGLSLHRELQLLVRAGLSEPQALDAATRLPAQRFGLDGRGVIEPGARGDLVIVAGNPLENIENTMAIRQIVKNGFIVDRSLDKAASSQMLDRALLGDFEAGLDAPQGFVWSSTDDTMANGKSEAALQRVSLEAGDPPHALEIHSIVRTGFPYPWAGGAIMSPAGVDISSYQALSFDVRGTPGTYRLMAFNEGAMGIPPTSNFTVSADWQTIELPLDELTGANWRSFTGFAWVAGPERGESTIYLDNVRLVKQ